MKLGGILLEYARFLASFFVVYVYSFILFLFFSMDFLSEINVDDIGYRSTLYRKTHANLSVYSGSTCVKCFSLAEAYILSLITIKDQLATYNVMQI